MTMYSSSGNTIKFKPYSTVVRGILQEKFYTYPVKIPVFPERIRINANKFWDPLIQCRIGKDYVDFLPFMSRFRDPGARAEFSEPGLNSGIPKLCMGSEENSRIPVLSSFLFSLLSSFPHLLSSFLFSLLSSFPHHLTDGLKISSRLSLIIVVDSNCGRVKQWFSDDYRQH